MLSVNFLHPEALRKHLPFPSVCESWVDVRKAFSEFHGTRSLNVKRMLAQAGMVFEGRLHSGIDDTRNIARILVHLIEQGCILESNASIANTSAFLPWCGGKEVTAATADGSAGARQSGSTGDAVRMGDQQQDASSDGIMWHKVVKPSRLLLLEEVNDVGAGQSGLPPPPPLSSCLTPRALRALCDDESDASSMDDSVSRLPIAITPLIQNYRLPHIQL